MKNINEMDSHVNQNESSNQLSGKVRRSFRRFIRVAIVLLLLVGGAFFGGACLGYWIVKKDDTFYPIVIAALNKIKRKES